MSYHACTTRTNCATCRDVFKVMSHCRSHETRLHRPHLVNWVWILARHSKPKLQLTWGVTRIKCCENIFLKLPEVTEKRYFLLIWKKFTNRDIWFKRKTRTTKPRQHGLCQSGENGSSSDNIVTWDIRSRRSWLVHCDTQEQDGKLYGLFSKSYVVQRAKHDLYRCHTVQECHHAAYVLTSTLALTWLTWKSEMEPPLKH